MGNSRHVQGSNDQLGAWLACYSGQDDRYDRRGRTIQSFNSSGRCRLSLFENEARAVWLEGSGSIDAVDCRGTVAGCSDCLNSHLE